MSFDQFADGTPERWARTAVEHAQAGGRHTLVLPVSLVDSVLDSLSNARSLAVDLIEHEPERPSEFGFGVVEATAAAGVVEVHAPFFSRGHAAAGVEALRATNQFFQEMGRNRSEFHIVDLIPVEDGRG